MTGARVAVLFARADSVYKKIQVCDVWDAGRDARKWPGGMPVIAHPPCRAWGRLRHFAKPRPDEKELAIFAVEQLRIYGGVLEHPAKSTLWAAAGLPAPGGVDKFGGWTLPVLQSAWGHRADKATFLYVVGCAPAELPVLPLRLEYATHVIGSRARNSDGTRKLECSKAERERTPIALAYWLVELAMRAGVGAAA